MVHQTLVFLARSMVEYPDDVRVDESPGDRGTIYHLHVHPDDIGRVIGRGGRMARSIRQVARAAAAREDVFAIIEIGD